MDPCRRVLENGARGVYAGLGTCVGRGTGGFTVYRPRHWATGVMVRFGGGMETPEEHAHFGTIDVLTGLCACVALGAALLARDRDGVGGVAHASLAAAGNLIQAQFMYDHEARAPFDEPSGREVRD